MGTKILSPQHQKCQVLLSLWGAPGPRTYTHRLLWSFSLCVSHSLSLCFGSLISENPRLPTDPQIRPQRLDEPSAQILSEDFCN